MKAKLLISIVFILAIASCVNQKNELSLITLINGVVQDSDKNKPLSNVKVVVYKSTLFSDYAFPLMDAVYSDQNGNYSLEFIHEKAGYSIDKRVPLEKGIQNEIVTTMSVK